MALVGYFESTFFFVDDDVLISLHATCSPPRVFLLPPTDKISKDDGSKFIKTA